MFELFYPKNEERRLEVLSVYEEVAMEAKEQFDELTGLAAKLLKMPGAFIAFMRREEQVVQAAQGMETYRTERRQTFCSSVIFTGKPLLIQDARENPSFADHPLVAGDPHLRFYLGVPLTAPTGEVIGTLCVIDYNPRSLSEEDVGILKTLASQAMTQLELRRKERELTAEVRRARRAEARFRRLLDASPDAILLLDGDKVLAYNGSARELFGLKGETGLLGEGVFDILARWGALDPATERSLRRHAATARRKGVTRFEWLQRCAGGSYHPVEVTLSVVELDEQVHFLVILHDISQQKENERILERERRQAQNANRIKDTFLSMISHDLKSPLSSVLSMLELLEESDGELPGMDRRSVYRDLKSSVAVLLEMTTQLLNLHRLQSGTIEINKESVEPRFLASQVRLSLDQRLNEKGVEFRNELPPGEVVEADPALFREVLFNLLSNAVKFCRAGDTITVRRGDNGSLQVADTGVGISEERLPELFEKEKKTTTLGTDGEPGTGLGLPLCRDIMEAHGGEITLSSSPGAGSTFSLHFPELSHVGETAPRSNAADSVS
ncbi:MAG: ATP-binding protein [Alkalispirochaetaceae bacterium]